MKGSISTALAIVFLVTFWYLPDCANLACASDWSYSHALPGDWNNYIGPVVADLDIRGSPLDFALWSYYRYHVQRFGR